MPASISRSWIKTQILEMLEEIAEEPDNLVATTMTPPSAGRA